MAKNQALYDFANDVYDVLMGNTQFITQSQFIEKYDCENVELNCSAYQITIGDFTITMEKNV